MNILSIQSHVAYGHVGNAAATFPLQRIGVEVWPVQTVQFSNHPGYGAWRGRVFSAATIRLVVQGIEERGVLGECDGVISGYLGSPDTGEAVVESTQIRPCFRPARIPSCPRATASSASVFVTIERITSTCSATSRGVPSRIRPRSTSHCAFSRVRL